MGEPLDPVSGDFRHETWGSPSAVEPAEYAPPSLLERSGPPQYAPGVLPTHEETSEPSKPNYPIYAFLLRDRRALCIQHELGKLSAAEVFNRADYLETVLATQSDGHTQAAQEHSSRV
ncbi:uncharacterized protein HfgLR_22055 (plasmid) [Haloferax gibbonsii]|uniref:Uncharacterized protein n=1 Tax=Haloferax gibbonsii TaxID=35746 RepID=A0A871BKS0_HALGI|nr:uncharacterized protein HfgLR_22055 [Haloferax gibbonsii]